MAKKQAPKGAAGARKPILGRKKKTSSENEKDQHKLLLYVAWASMLHPSSVIILVFAFALLVLSLY